MRYTTTVVDCSVKGANYSRTKPYILPRIKVWPTYRNTCIGFILDIGFKSYQLYWYLPKAIARQTTKLYKDT